MSGAVGTLGAVLTRYIPILLLAAVWEAVTRSGLVPAGALPPLDTVAK